MSLLSFAIFKFRIITFKLLKQHYENDSVSRKLMTDIMKIIGNELKTIRKLAI